MLPSSVKNLPEVFIITPAPPPGRWKLLVPTRQHFVENLFPPTAERGWRKL